MNQQAAVRVVTTQTRSDLGLTGVAAFMGTIGASLVAHMCRYYHDSILKCGANPGAGMKELVWIYVFIMHFGSLMFIQTGINSPIGNKRDKLNIYAVCIGDLVAIIVMYSTMCEIWSGVGLISIISFVCDMSLELWHFNNLPHYLVQGGPAPAGLAVNDMNDHFRSVFTFALATITVTY